MPRQNVYTLDTLDLARWLLRVALPGVIEETIRRRPEHADELQKLGTRLRQYENIGPQTVLEDTDVMELFVVPSDLVDTESPTDFIAKLDHALDRALCLLRWALKLGAERATSGTATLWQILRWGEHCLHALMLLSARTVWRDAHPKPGQIAALPYDDWWVGERDYLPATAVDAWAVTLINRLVSTA